MGRGMEPVAVLVVPNREGVSSIGCLALRAPPWNLVALRGLGHEATEEERQAEGENKGGKSRKPTMRAFLNFVE